jgi:hypothetical protein
MLAIQLDREVREKSSQVAKQRDLFENGLITKAEFDAFMASGPNVAKLAAYERLYPNCGFVSKRYYYSSAKQALELLKSGDPQALSSIASESATASSATGTYSPSTSYDGSTSGSTYQAPSYGSGSVNVRGYYRKDGTYVRPHTRSRPRRR